MKDATLRLDKKIAAGIFAIQVFLACSQPIWAQTNSQIDAAARSLSISPPAAPATSAYVPNARAVSLYNLGLTAYKQGSPESAVIFFKRACDIDPNLADAQYNLGVIYQVQKRYKEAIPRFEEVLRIKPTDPDAHFQLGVVLQDTGRPQEARQHLSAIPPNNTHFNDAQRRIMLLNNTVAPAVPVSNDLGQQSAPLTQGYPVNTGLREDLASKYGASNPYAEASVYGTTQVSAVNPQANQSYVQPTQQLVQQPATAYVPATPVMTPGGVGASASAPAPSTDRTGPVPILANTSLRVIATGFSAPSGLAFDRNGNLYVANYMTNSVDRVGADGIRNVFCSGANLRGPIGLVIDQANNLYVANYNGGTVARINPSGVSTVVASGFRKPYYLTLDRDGNLYVSQQEDNSVVKIALPKVIGVKAQ